MKRSLLMVLALVVSMSLALGSTIAYLQDSDEDHNVMTLGNVHIEQIEQEWNADKSDLVDFTQAKPLYPYVGAMSWENDKTDGGAYRRFTMNNVVDKYVSVENVGVSDAYVRTIFAFEMGDYTKDEFKYNVFGYSFNDLNGREYPGLDWVWGDEEVYTINGHRYLVRVATYNKILESGDTTIPSLLQVYLSNKADNEDMVRIDGNSNGLHDILVLTQAMQVMGFEANNAQTIADAAAFALNEGFCDQGKTMEDMIPVWFDNLAKSPVYDATNPPLDLDEAEPTVLEGKQDPITVTGTGTLILRNVTIDAESTNAITVAAGAKAHIDIQGNVKLNAPAGCDAIEVVNGASLKLTGTGRLTAVGGGAADSANGGNGIGGAGEIVISNLAGLTSEGWGKHGFGIGGETSRITIENTNIDYVKGGYVQPNLINDPKYGKSEPEGGAAIGSSSNGAKITLNNVTIDKADGGSKAAGIGGKFWTGVDITIKNSTIKEVNGGNASAGIGGSRVEGASAADPCKSIVTINIVDSVITANGGEYGAGIGSGYDTHCQGVDIQPLTTVNIRGNSVINAKGGRYAAGIGTGYHVAKLAGEIESTVTVNAASGEKLYKDTYTKAQDIGFGVVDPAREGANNSSSITYAGTVIAIPAP